MSVKIPADLIQFTSSFGVDAGNISAIDAGLVREYGGNMSDENRVVPLPPGRYLVVMHVDDCWNGSVTAAGVVDVPSGILAFGDVCYLWSGDTGDKWHEFLKATDYCQKKLPGFLPLNTGGDGYFATDVIISPLKELEPEDGDDG